MKSNKNKDLLELRHLSKEKIFELLKLSKELKQSPFQTNLRNKTIALIFSKSSTRTRVSFEVGISQLGGNSLFLSPNEIQLGRGESIEDTAKVLSRYIDGVVIRTFDHGDIERFATNATMPVINGLTDLSHPCQVLTDLFTIQEKLGDFTGKKIVYFGDCSNNMAYSWIMGASVTGCHLVLTGHPHYLPDRSLIDNSLNYSDKDAKIEIIEDPFEAAKGAHVIYSDVWTSMGQEKESSTRKKELEQWQINEKIMSLTSENSIFMHCLPAHRGEEVTEEIIDGLQSVVFDQAENRLHVQKAILSTYIS